MKAPQGQNLKQFYQSQQLDSAKLEQLKTIYQLQQKQANSFSNWLAIAASVFLIGLIALLPGKFEDAKSIGQRVAAEVVLNHQKNLQAEFHSLDGKQLAGKMNKLDFDIRLPAGLRDDLQLAGARYCSIQGNIAVQLQFFDARNKRYTLYQTLDKPSYTAAKDKTIAQGEIVVSMWRERGFFYALAQRQ